MTSDRQVRSSRSRSLAQAKLTPISEAVTVSLGRFGYARRGRAYVRQGADTDVVIGLQMGAFGVPAVSFVTVNLAVHVHAIDRWTARRAGISATGENGHWRSRLGTLIGGQDRWWCLEPMPAWALDPVLAPVFGHAATDLIGEIVEVAVPTLDRLADPGNLLSEWLAVSSTLDNDAVQFASVIAIERGDVSALAGLRSRLVAAFPDPRWPGLRDSLLDVLDRDEPG